MVFVKNEIQLTVLFRTSFDFGQVGCVGSLDIGLCSEFERHFAGSNTAGNSYAIN